MVHGIREASGQAIGLLSTTKGFKRRSSRPARSWRTSSKLMISQGIGSMSSEGLTRSACANPTMFSNPRLRSPRSTPPIYLRCKSASSARQRLVIWGWVVVIVTAGMYPPWAQRGYPAGYHPIFAPPPGRALHVDRSRLLVEWVIASVLAGGLYLAWPTGRGPK
jgi:hypothetical protein